MKQIFLIPLIGFLTLSQAQAADSAVFNVSESFVVARSYKLGDGQGALDIAPTIPAQQKETPTCKGDDCDIPGHCDTAADCDQNEYCTTLHVCKNLCEKGKTYDGVVCETLPTTPSCAIETSGHVSYCACTSTSCGPAWKCSMIGVRYQCEMCLAGEKCNCPDGKISNGKGECVVCNTSDTCAWNQYCSAPGTTASACKEVSCPAGQYVENHACHSCSAAMPGCKACSSSKKCDTCEIAYNLRADKSGCELKTCTDGKVLNYTTGECVACPNGATSCESNPDGGDPVATECEDGKTLVNGICVDDDKDADCRRICGNDGFYYDRPGAKLDGKERVCTRYPLSCGYGCTKGWDIDYLVNGTVYTCQTAIQEEADDDKDADCRRICGNDGFYYDRPGAKLDGKERVCTRYPLSCGYDCTTGWDIDYLVNGTVYTCQTARQTGAASGDGEDKDADCRRICGNDGFYYDRPGDLKGGKERVCTRYPLSCGYDCTTGWDIRTLVNGTLYTCQTAQQTAPKDDKDADCRRICGNDEFYYDRPGDLKGGKERVCTRYPLSCGYGCTTGWDIRTLVNGTLYTCQTAQQTQSDNSKKACTGSPSKGDGGECEKACGKGFGELRSGEKLNGKERVCTKYPKGGGYDCTTGWDIKYLVDGLHTCQTAIMSDTPVSVRN